MTIAIIEDHKEYTMDDIRLSQPGTAQDLEQKIRQKIAEVDGFVRLLPSITIIHRCGDLRVEYMSPQGTKILGVSIEELRSMGVEYYYRYFNKEDAEDYVPKVFDLMERNSDDDIVCFFQQVRPTEDHEWSWYACCTRILMRDEDGRPALLISTVLPIDERHHLTSKIARVTEEKLFLRRNYEAFARLSRREQQVLRLMAMGKSSAEIAEALFISPATAETHRRNIRQKLDANTSYELAQYARAFDLI